MSFFNQNEDETVRQTLERVMREKGMWKEPKTMHTEIGDFSYYDDDDGNGNAPTNAANNQFGSSTTGFAANNQSAGGTRDYTVNTESLIGKPSSYFQNGNSVFVNNNAGGFGNSNTSGANTTIGQHNNNAGSNNSIVQSITALNPINAGYQIGQKIGEFAADTKLAYDYWQKMNQTGNQLVTTFGSGQGADIDNYYHPLLQ